MDLTRFVIVGPIVDVQSIAVSSGVRELRNLKRLFGKGRWRKLKGIAVVRFENDFVFRAAIHWYEAHGSESVRSRSKHCSSGCHEK